MLNGPVSAEQVTLNSAVGITEPGSGAIDASVLQGSAAGATTRDGANPIGRIGTSPRPAAPSA